VTTLILLRHGRSSANVSGVLAGRSPGVELDDTGRAQAEKLVGRLDGVPVSGIVCSPMLRCEQTVAPLAAARELTPVSEPELAEVDYGSWTGSALKNLVKEPLWKVVQAHPSAAVFPDGEGLAGMQARAVAAVRRHGARIAAEHGLSAVWIACTHGDVIKAVVADALGTHLDSFQRITADPASMSVIRYTALRPFVIHVNHTGNQLTAGLLAKPKSEQAGTNDNKDGEVPPGDAVVGGSTD
jgi:probable phosphomutase (TIGR03848 family)